MDLKQIGKRIAAARKACGITQRELGEACGVTPQYITVLEAGHKIPSLCVLVSIADRLKLSIDYIMRGDRR